MDPPNNDEERSDQKFDYEYQAAFDDEYQEFNDEYQESDDEYQESDDEYQESDDEYQDFNDENYDNSNSDYPERMAMAMSAVQQGGLHIREAAKKYHVPFNTLQCRWGTKPSLSMEV